MAAMKDAAWIKANIEVVDNYLKGEFENYSIAHQTDNTLTHTFTVDNGKKRFTLVIGWPIFAERRLTQARIGGGLNKENVAEQMRLHKEAGYHWTPLHEDTIQRGDM
jgi:hypothetical protein